MHASTFRTDSELSQVDDSYLQVKVISDVVTRCLGNPFYVIKVRLQSKSLAQRATFRSEARSLWKEGGVAGLLRGVIPSVVRYALYSLSQVCACNVTFSFNIS